MHMEDKFRIFRYYVAGDRRETLYENLTWKEALDHLDNIEHMFDTAQSVQSKEITEKNGPWWDCWERMTTKEVKK